MKIVILTLSIALASLLVWQYQQDDGAVDEQVQTSDQPAGEPDSVALEPSAQRADAQLPTAQAVPSLRGTAVDGRLVLDRHGQLLVDEQLRNLFDYFYTTVGEVTFEQASESIRQYLRSQLPEPARGQALGLLQNYIDYKTALADLERQFPVVADLEGLRAREEAVQRLRASLFSGEAHQAFFGAEEAYNAFTLERLAILQDASLPPEDASERIEALRTGLPEDVQALLVPQIHQQLSAETAALQARDAADWEVRALRLSLVGPEATERLEALDVERAQWQQRLDAFDRERRAIQAYPGLAPQDQQAAIEALLEEGFTPTERLRVAALLDNS